MRYTGDFGCRSRWVPHDIKILFENKMVKIEVCQICNRKYRWNKGYKGRIANNEYLKVHARNFAQKFGATKRLYNKIYKPEKMIIKL